MENNSGRYILVAIVAFLLGWAIGLFLFGWLIWPVEYTGAGPQDLTEAHQQIYLTALADLYAFDSNMGRVQQALGDWPEADQEICQLANTSADPAAAARYNALAAVLNGTGCTGAVGAIPPAEDEGGGRGTLGNIVLICGLFALLLVVVAAILIVIRRRGTQTQPGPVEQRTQEPPAAAPISELESAEEQITAIARFSTTFVRGNDTYDESFSIENEDGDFLGECGVGLSDTIGTETPKNVTAFEVWLFDKNDIRTVTKVVMSDHAFFDEAIKAKLAPKGEPVLARPNETIVLETASLIVNAEIVELEYGTSELPPQSFFERFTVELSAWAKEGDFGEPDVQGRVDDMLEF
jgi:hypothetical protein